MAVTEAIIAEETIRLSALLAAVKAQYISEKAQMAQIAMQLQMAAASIQQLDMGIQSATQGTDIGSRETKRALEKAANDVRNGAMKLTGF